MGSKKTKSTNTYRPAGYIQDASRLATQMATDYVRQPYQAYTGERVAGLSDNERMAMGMARDQAASNRTALDGVSTRFDQADMQAYMNPYIKNALDPAAREVREMGAQRLQQTRGQAASRGAFSGSRAILAERAALDATDQAIGDLYGRGYAEAFESGANRWAADQDRALKKIGLNADMVNSDIRNLMMTGESARTIEQMQKDFDYGQFVEKRDWSGKNAALLTDILAGLKGSYESTEISKTKESGGLAGQLIGAAATIGAAYFTGGASLFAGGAAGAGSLAGKVAGGMGKLNVTDMISSGIGGEYRGLGIGGK